jgi:hypothetical protein
MVKRKHKFILLMIMLSTGLVYSQNFQTKHVIDDDLERAKKHAIIDIDLDGDLDVVCAANPETDSGAEDAAKPNVLLYLNDGSSIYTRQVINYRFRHARGMAVGDLNSDGYPEVIVGNRHADSTLVWYANPTTGYNQEWSKNHIGSGAPLNYQVLIIDLDKDGIIDIVDGTGDSAIGGDLAGDYIRWFENDGQGIPTLIEHNIINYASLVGIAVADFDLDNDNDVVGMCWLNQGAASTGESVEWWEQADINTWNAAQTMETLYGGNDAVAVDLDNDGDADILGAGYKLQTIDWWQNGGAGNFSAKTTVRTSFQYTRNVQAKDMDGDTDIDILACADAENTFSWFENNGSESFTEHTISTDFTYAYFISAADIDGDGDEDIAGTAQDANETGNTVPGQLAWWENSLDDDKIIAAGNPATELFWAGKVGISLYSAAGGKTTVFYNHGENSDRSRLVAGIDHIALSGFYTIVTAAANYTADLEFSYDGVSEWSAINDENDLVICIWDENNNRWDILNNGSQTIDAVNNTITVSGVTSGLEKYSRFTLGSTTEDNSLPVKLSAFAAKTLSNSIQLYWKTESEVDNQGFELWRKSDADSQFVMIATYLSEPDLVGLGSSTSGKSYQYNDYQVQYGQNYKYRLVDVNAAGQRFARSKLSVAFVPKSMVRIVGSGLPETMQLEQNYPNPFNHTTIIGFTVPIKEEQDISNVTLLIFNALGQRVRTLYSGTLSPGNYEMRWDGCNDQGSTQASGTYIYMLRVDEYSLPKTMIMVK